MDNQENYEGKTRKESGSYHNDSSTASSRGPLGNNQISRKNYCFGQ
jgi:hypothetical protein